MGKACSKTVYFSDWGEEPPLQPQPPKNIANDANFLYIILPYFNYCNYERRTELFLQFISRIRYNPVIRIVVVEAGTPDTGFLLPKTISGIYRHIAFHCKEHVWIKENLINLAVAQLPPTWKYMAWVDADITFLNPEWAEQTIIALDNKYDVVQMYQTCVNLGPLEEALKIDRSFGYMHCESGRAYHKTAKYGFWHPGYTWAMNRKAYDQLGGLIDFGILGSGDRHMALAFIGLVEYSYPGNIHENYKQELARFQQRAIGIRLGWIPGTILHHWHGRLEDRKYQERWLILTKNQYDPMQDIVRNKDGVIHLTQTGQRLTQQLTDYFLGRKEDNKSVV